MLVNQLEGNLLQPVIMGRTLSLHPLVILLALTAGTILGGILGAILSTPTASVAWTGRQGVAHAVGGRRGRPSGSSGKKPGLAARFNRPPAVPARP